MAARKRKSPEKKAGRLAQGLFFRAGAALAAFVRRHPSVAGSYVAFIVVFSFVSANALWYQPGAHPSPILHTRDPHYPGALAGFRAVAAARPEDVTTFRIERADPTQTGGIDAAGGGQAASTLLMDVQKELVRRGLYDGAADGVIGPRTAAAILSFQLRVGMEQTGDVTPDLLAALRTDSKGGARAVPTGRPAADVTSKESQVDPVATAIRTAEKIIVTARDGKATDTRATAGKLSASALVQKIQRGLSNIAYTDVNVDGVAGAQTRAAIRRFEKHYRLPENGEPNEKVLMKLKEIGAL